MAEPEQLAHPKVQGDAIYEDSTRLQNGPYVGSLAEPVDGGAGQDAGDSEHERLTRLGV